MPSIDERVVEMKFKDDQFKKGIAGTLASLTGLKKGLDMKGATKGLQEVDKAGRGIKLDAIANGVQGLQSKFSALSIAGITALTNIANRAVDTGLTLVKSLTIDPIKMGLEEYETQLNSVQTIMANTGLTGEKGLGKVNGALDELNTYADQTIYNFTEMAKNIGTFTAAGVDLDTSTKSIKGIANLAALSGSNSQQASTAMYQLSQALAAGKVGLQDWNSVVNAGMGGKVFQDALKETAKAHGTNVDAIIKKEGSFRESLTKSGWLTTEVLTETLDKFTGDLSEAELKQQGYNDAQIKSIMELGKTANDAATKVKTMTQLVDTLKEAAQSGWTQSWETIFGDFNEAKELFTAASEELGGMIDASSKNRNKILNDWKDLGGRDLAIRAIADAWKALLSVINPIKEAFRDIFPAMTGKDLYNFTKVLADLAKNLSLSDEAAENLKRTFRGVFAVLDIGWMVIKGLAGVILDLLGVIFEGSGGFLELTGSIGDWLVSVRDAIKNGEGLTKFFDGLSSVLRKPLEWVKALAKAIGDFFNQVGSGGGDSVTNAFNPLVMLGKFATGLFKGLWEILKGVGTFLAPFAADFMTFISDLGAGFGDMAGNIDFDHVLGLINTGLFGGLLLLLRKFVKGEWLEQIKGLFGGGEGGLISNITGIFGELTGTLQAMQTNLKAGTLMKIAGAIAILTASVVVLSTIDDKKLAKALGAITAMFIQLGVALKVFEIMSSGLGFLKLPFIAASLILLSVAVLILASAAKKLSDLDWQELAKGLVGVGGLLGSLNLFMAFAKTSKGAVGNAAGLILLGVAINVLAKAVEKFGDMDWQEIGKGLTTLAGVFGLLAIFSKLMGKSGGLVAAGAGMILMGTAMNILLKPLKEFGDMEWKQIAKSLVMFAGALASMAGASLLMTGAIPGAFAMFIMASAIRVLTPALEAFGEMDWQEIAKALVMLAGSLAIMAGAAYLMSAALPGAAAMLVMAFALNVLKGPLLAFSKMEWGEILKSLTMLAGALTVLGIAGILILPAIPGLLLLGVAITLLGTGTMLAGVGLMMFATALGLLAVTGGAAIAVLVASIRALLELIPFAAEQLALGFQAWIDALAENAVAITEAFVTIGMAILNGINTLAPEIIATIINLIWLLVNAINENAPKLAVAGGELIVKLLNGIASNMTGIVTAGTNVIVAFLRGIQANVGRVADEGAKTVIAFIRAVAASIRNNRGDLEAAGKELGWAIADGLTGGLASKLIAVKNGAAALGRAAIGAIKSAIDSNSPSKESMYLGEFIGDGLTVGMDNRLKDVDGAGSNMGGRAIDSLKTALSGMNSVIDSEMDTSPTITPVLDLTGVRKAAGDISGMMSNPNIEASTTRSRASLVGQNMRYRQEEVESPENNVSGGTTLIQNNYSPKALSEIEIYRNTKSQLSLAKEALNR